MGTAKLIIKKRGSHRQTDTRTHQSPSENCDTQGDPFLGVKDPARGGLAVRSLRSCFIISSKRGPRVEEEGC